MLSFMCFYFAMVISRKYSVGNSSCYTLSEHYTLFQAVCSYCNSRTFKDLLKLYVDYQFICYSHNKQRECLSHFLICLSSNYNILSFVSFTSITNVNIMHVTLQHMLITYLNILIQLCTKNYKRQTQLNAAWSDKERTAKHRLTFRMNKLRLFDIMNFLLLYIYFFGMLLIGYLKVKLLLYCA